MLPANTPILRALSLPAITALTCAGELGENAVLAALPARLAAGLSLPIVREPDYARDQLASWVARLASSPARPAAGCWSTPSRIGWPAGRWTACT
ncbi:MAG: hypothetical protein U1E47_02060 [Rivihabitans pingtungensis]